MYTEEELLDALDILIEDYGIDEDEAIDMIAEAYENELLSEKEWTDEELLQLKGYDGMTADEIREHFKKRFPPKENSNTTKKDDDTHEFRNAFIKTNAQALALVGGVTAAKVGGKYLYKKYKNKKEDEARRNRGLRGKLRRLREDEEFTEVVDILVEEYGFDEDEAIDLVNETLTLGSAARGMSNMYKDVASRRENYHNLKNNSDQHSQEVINNARNGYYKSAGKAAAATAVGALALGYAAKDAKDKFPKLKAKLDRKRRMKQRMKRMQRRMRSY